MYKVLTIGGNEYKLEYTIEASLYDECIEKLVAFFGNTFGGANEEEITKDMDEEQKMEVRKLLLKNSISGIGNLPQTALSVFYAGLLEHHGSEGDKSIKSKRDAKELVRTYFKEHTEDGKDNFFDLLTICLEQMVEDGFFKRTGLEKIVARSEAEPKKNRAQRRAAAKSSGK